MKILLCLLVLLPACQSKTDPLTFAYQNRIGSAVCMVADRMGFFKDQGLEVKAFRFNSGPACSETLFTGAAKIGTMGDATAVIALSRNPRLKILFSHSFGEHRHRVVALPGAGIKHPMDLKGKTLGIKKGTSTHGGLLALFKKIGMDPTQVRLMDMRPQDMPEALASKAIDAFAASEPTPSLAEAKGAFQVCTLGDLNNLYPILTLATEEVVMQEETVKKFKRALKRAVDHIQQQPKETAKLLTEVTGLKEEAVIKAMARHTFVLGLSPHIQDSLKETAGFLKNQGLIDRIPDLTP